MKNTKPNEINLLERSDEKGNVAQQIIDDCPGDVNNGIGEDEENRAGHQLIGQGRTGQSVESVMSKGQRC